MTDPDRERALQQLAHAIRECADILGPVSTARLLATVALDLSDPRLVEPDLHHGHVYRNTKQTNDISLRPASGRHRRHDRPPTWETGRPAS